MRLLNVNTLQFGNFFNSQVPKYCILSHRWGEDEVTYENVKDQKINTTGAGYQKLAGACKLAQQRGYEWIWADMCCIDKSSSAELSEAINSMFVFYSQGDLCIAYLTDVPANCRAWQEKMYHFYRSEWFTRGWTLQELLASSSLHFYDHDYNYIGSKLELCPEVSERTGIAAKYLDGRKRFNDASIATRMSWASKRQTTRPEDEAYCLLGLFGVSIPPCYGEGAAAFYRLQCEILARSDDESILAWVSPDAKDDEPFGLLAESPRDFQHSRDVSRIKLRADKRQPMSLTGRGISFCHGFSQTNIKKIKLGTEENKTTYEVKTYIKKEGKVTVACDRRSKGVGWSRIAIHLREMSEGWFRVKCNRFHYTTNELYSHYFQTFYVPQPYLTTTPRFQENRKDVGAFVRRQFEQKQEEERTERKRDREKWRRNKKVIAGSAVVLGAFMGVRKLNEAREEKKNRERPKDSRSRSRNRSSDRHYAPRLAPDKLREEGTVPEGW